MWCSDSAVPEAGLAASRHPTGRSAEILTAVTAHPGSQDGDVAVAANGSDFLFELLGYLSNAPLTVPDDESRIREILNYLERPVAVVGGEEYRVSPVIRRISGSPCSAVNQAGVRPLPRSTVFRSMSMRTASRTTSSARCSDTGTDFQPSSGWTPPTSAYPHTPSRLKPMSWEGVWRKRTWRTLASLRARGTYLPSEPVTDGGFIEPDSQKFADSRTLSFAGSPRDSWSTSCAP